MPCTGLWKTLNQLVRGSSPRWVTENTPVSGGILISAGGQPAASSGTIFAGRVISTD